MLLDQTTPSFEGKRTIILVTWSKSRYNLGLDLLTEAGAENDGLFRIFHIIIMKNSGFDIKFLQRSESQRVVATPLGVL